MTQGARNLATNLSFGLGCVIGVTMAKLATFSWLDVGVLAGVLLAASIGRAIWDMNRELRSESTHHE